MSRSKFNVSSDKSKRTYEGITFDSVMEMQFYRDVVLPNYNSGKIKDFELQKPYILQPKFLRDGHWVRAIEYVADFYIVDKDGHEFILDVKGAADAVAKLKRKMIWNRYPELTYIWLTYTKKTGWIEYEKMQAIRRENKKRKKEHRLPKKKEEK